MKVFYALLVFFLVIALSQERYDSDSDGIKTSFQYCYKGVPLLPVFSSIADSYCQFKLGKPTSQLLQGSSVSFRPDSDSPCQDGSFKPHPDDCTLYLRCSCGKCETYRCIPGRHWNANENTCDWPDIAKCSFIKSDEEKIISAGTIATPATTTLASQSLNKDTTPEMTVKPVYNGTGYKVICYFTNAAWYRPGDGKYLPSDIDGTLCTHINYAYAALDDSTLTIKPGDSNADIDNEFYKKVTALRANGIKVLISLGGWTDSAGDKYSRLVNNPSARENFITNVIQFIDKNNFDGLDLDWVYPKCWQVDCSKGPSSDKQAFTALIRELSAAFKPKGLLLSAAVSPSKYIIEAGYEVAQLSKYLDWINVMTYDYYGYWEQHTGHVAPLYSIPGDSNPNSNVNSTINYWIDQGADPQKIIIGMPLYGTSYTLTDASNNTFFSLTKGSGEAGELTQLAGYLAFYEICDRVKNRGWTSVYNNEGVVGPYAYNENQWVSYDDIGQIVRKSKFIKQLHLGGAMIWRLDFDDFGDRCGCGKHPLLKAMNHELRGIQIDTKLTECT